MPRGRKIVGAQAGGRGATDGGGEGARGRARGRARATRGRRARGGRPSVAGAGSSESFHIGVITDEEVTVAPGVALEQPLHAKRRRVLQPEVPLAGSSFTREWVDDEEEDFTGINFPSPGPSNPMGPGSPYPLREVPSPGSFVEAFSTLTSTPTSSARAAALPGVLSTPTRMIATPEAVAGLEVNVPSPAQFFEVAATSTRPSMREAWGSSPSTSRVPKGPSNTSLQYNVLDPRLEDIINNGSDMDSEDEGGEDFLFDIPTRQIVDILDMAEDVALQTHGVVAGSVAQGVAGDVVGGPSTSGSSNTNLEGPVCGPNLFDFVWEPLPQPPVDPLTRRENFISPTGPVGSPKDPYEIFTAIWDTAIMEKIAVETNRYAEQCLLTKMNLGTLDGSSRLLEWKDTDVDELYIFFAIIMATGVVIKSDLTEYWSVNQDIFDTPYFGSYISYKRFIALSSMLHFINNEAIDISQLPTAEAKIYKIEPIVRHLNERFQSMYQLGQCISLDESLTQWKGWLSINQFIRNKAASKGVKTYEICDSKSGYLWRFKIHAGRQDNDEEYGYITSLVLQLLRGLENKGHTVYMDNYYNSPALARMLKCQGFDCVGTIRLNRQYVPEQLKSLVKSSLSPGSLEGCTSGDIDLLVWRDKNLVSLMSTYHGASYVARGGKNKPSVIQDYNVRMGGVDKKDQMLSTYPIERKRTTVWYKKLFRRLLNVSVLNTYIIYKEQSPPASDDSYPQYNHRNFRKALIKSLLAKHSKREVKLHPGFDTSSKVIFSEVMLQHLPKEYPLSGNTANKKRARCSVCKKRVSVYCPGCNVALCTFECFGKHHSKR